MKIIDMHNHAFADKISEKAVINLGNFYEFPPLSQKGTYQDLKDNIKKAKIDKFLFCATATTPHQVVNLNNYIISHLENCNIGFGSIHIDFENPIDEIKRITSLGIAGIKLHPDFQKFNADDIKLEKIYSYCRDNNIPILIHAGDKRFDYSSPKRIRNIIDNFKGIKIIAAHLGGYSRWEESKKYLCGQNIFFDTSSAIAFLTSNESVNMIRNHGADKIFFGTDYPITTNLEELKRFLALHLTEKEQEAILYKNAENFLQL